MGAMRNEKWQDISKALRSKPMTPTENKLLIKLANKLRKLINEKEQTVGIHIDIEDTKRDIFSLIERKIK